MRLSALLLSFTFIFNLSEDNSVIHVLCYHAFIDSKNKFCFSSAELKSHIEYFRKRKFKFVSLSDIVNGRISGNKNILITVDDGNKSVYNAYHKVFKPLKIKPLLSIYPSVISKKKYALTWNQLRELSEQGCDIAAHGFHHRNINQNLYTKNRKSFNREILLSKSLLEKKLKRKIEIFVYPYGSRSDVTLKALKKAGYKYAFTIEKGGLLLPSHLEESTYELPRYMVTRGNWKKYFRMIVNNSVFNNDRFIANRTNYENRYKDRYKKDKKTNEADNYYSNNLLEFITDTIDDNYSYMKKIYYNYKKRDKHEVKQITDDKVIEMSPRKIILSLYAYGNTGNVVKSNKAVGAKSKKIKKKNNRKKKMNKFQTEYYDYIQNTFKYYSIYVNIIRKKVIRGEKKIRKTLGFSK